MPLLAWRILIVGNPLPRLSAFATLAFDIGRLSASSVNVEKDGWATAVALRLLAASAAASPSSAFLRC